jgi:hypothetical protein
MQGSSITENFQLISFVMLFGGKADTTKLQSCIVGRFRIDTWLLGAPEGLLSSSTKRPMEASSNLSSESLSSQGYLVNAS